MAQKPALPHVPFACAEKELATPAWASDGVNARCESACCRIHRHLFREIEEEEECQKFNRHCWYHPSPPLLTARSQFRAFAGVAPRLLSL